MVKLYEATALAVPSSGIQIPIAGIPVRMYVALAVDTIAGSATGPAVTVTAYGGPETDTLQVAYGFTQGKWFDAKWLLIQGSGATIELKVDTRMVVVEAQVLPKVTATVTGTVSTSIDAQTVGVAPAAALAGPAVDPRQIRALTTADQVTPKGGDLTSGSLASNQLPAALDGTGGLKTASQRTTTTSHGTVDAVHDQGA